jgi:hypothetical protein
MSAGNAVQFEHECVAFSNESATTKAAHAPDRVRADGRRFIF